jgi:two-component system, OmpR family, sensor histidine kinase VicK
VVDQSLCLAVELKDDTLEASEEDAIGLATYSNSDSMVYAYISIFENLWMRAEL